MIQYVLFDLDDTLYPAGAGLMKEISTRITRYVAKHLGITSEAADALRLKYYRRYGSSVRSLVENYHLKVADFLAFVHDVDVESQLARDADLDCLLGCVQSPKVIFTNAPRAYTQRVLRALGIEHHFAHVFDYEFGEYLGKPDLAVYRKAQAALSAPSDALVMVDDGARNLAPARALGWKTVYVNASGNSTTAVVDFVVQDLWLVAAAFQQLGVMDAAHRAIAEHRLAGCAWAKRQALVSQILVERLK